MAGIKRYEDLTNSWADADTGIMPKLRKDPYAPIDAASVTSIDDSGAGFDDFGHQIGAPAPMPTPQSWGDMAHGIATAPIRLGGAIVDSLSPYHQNEHPITDPNASSWQVPPLISESWDAISSFGNAYNNGMSEDDMRRNANIAAGLTMGGGGLAARPAGGVGMFAGRLAKTADHEALARAEQMATQGADRRAIWDSTGWFQGPDQKWRFEIDDSGSQFTIPQQERHTLNGQPIEGSAAFVFRHPELWNSYPDVARTPVKIARGVGPYDGFYDGSQIGGNASTTKAARDLMLHETQHAIQNFEGFGRGSNPDFGHKAADVVAQAQKAYELNRARTGPDPDAELLAELGFDAPNTSKPWDELTSRQKLEWNDAGRGRLYRLSSGEVESRNVEARANMSADERRATPPWETQDIPDADQIVRMYSNASKEASLPALATALDMSPEARLARARDMGFDTDTPVYHGTMAIFDEFNPSFPHSSNAVVPQVHFTTSKNEALQHGENVLETYLRGRYADIANPMDMQDDVIRWLSRRRDKMERSFEK